MPNHPVGEDIFPNSQPNSPLARLQSFPQVLSPSYRAEMELPLSPEEAVDPSEV